MKIFTGNINTKNVFSRHILSSRSLSSTGNPRHNRAAIFAAATASDQRSARKMPKYIKRITLFKVPKEEDIDAILAQYAILRKTAVKDGKPYIVSNEANRIINASEERAHGYTIAVQSTFVSQEDVDYYDSQCEAHKALKAVSAPRRTGAATFHFESDMEPGK